MTELLQKLRQISRISVKLLDVKRLLCASVCFKINVDVLADLKTHKRPWRLLTKNSSLELVSQSYRTKDLVSIFNICLPIEQVVDPFQVSLNDRFVTTVAATLSLHRMDVRWNAHNLFLSVTLRRVIELLPYYITYCWFFWNI